MKLKRTVATLAALVLATSGSFIASTSAQAVPPSPAVPIKVKGNPGVVVKGNPAVSATTSAQSRTALLAGPPYYVYAGTRQSLTGTNSALGFAANLTIESPYIASADTSSAYDAHSIMELAVQSGTGNSVEVGWRKGIGGNPELFVFHWVNNVPQGYGTGFVEYAPTCSVSTNFCPGDSVASLVTTPGGTSKRFQISYSSTGAGVWWVYFDGKAMGYYPGSLWTSAGGFTSAKLFQGYMEVASGTSATPCTDLGNGRLASDTSAARIGSIALISPSTGVTTNFTAFVDPTTAPTGVLSATNLSTTTMRGGGPLWNATGTAAGTTGAC